MLKGIGEGGVHTAQAVPIQMDIFLKSGVFYRYGVIGCHWFCLCVVVVIFVHYVTETFVNSVFRLFLHAMVHFFDIEVRKKNHLQPIKYFEY